MSIGFPVKADYVTGDVLTANNMNDLSGTLNTIQSVEYAAGKNAIINGDFFVNQRSFSSTTTNGTYGFDRWRIDCSGGTVTYSAQTFTLGTAPVAGYEGTNYARILTSGQSAAGDLSIFLQRIEDVRTFANQTVTISFWAKAASGTPKIAAEYYQVFGSGGSPSSSVSTPAGTVTLTTSWARYSITTAIPSISGKTIGTTANTSTLDVLLWVSAGTTYATRASSIGIQNNTFDVWGVQLEESSTASAFQTATGTIQGELAACQRYYYRNFPAAADKVTAQGLAATTTLASQIVVHKVTMRVAPTSVDFTALQLNDTNSNTAVTNCTINQASADLTNLTITVASGLTAYRPMNLNTSSSAGYLGLSAEL